MTRADAARHEAVTAALEDRLVDIADAAYGRGDNGTLRDCVAVLKNVRLTHALLEAVIAEWQRTGGG